MYSLFKIIRGFPSSLTIGVNIYFPSATHSDAHRRSPRWMASCSSIKISVLQVRQSCARRQWHSTPLLSIALYAGIRMKTVNREMIMQNPIICVGNALSPAFPYLYGIKCPISLRRFQSRKWPLLARRSRSARTSPVTCYGLFRKIDSRPACISRCTRTGTAFVQGFHGTAKGFRL